MTLGQAAILVEVIPAERTQLESLLAATERQLWNACLSGVGELVEGGSGQYRILYGGLA